MCVGWFDLYCFTGGVMLGGQSGLNSGLFIVLYAIVIYGNENAYWDSRSRLW